MPDGKVITPINWSLTMDAVEVAEIFSYKHSGLQADKKEITSASTATAVKEFKKGLIDYGEITLGLRYNKSLATHQTLRTAALAHTEHAFVVSYPAGSADTIGGYIAGMDSVADIGEVWEATVTIVIQSLS